MPLFKAGSIFEAETSTTLKSLPGSAMNFFICNLAEDTCLHQLHLYHSMVNVDFITLPMGRPSTSVGKASDK